MMRLPKNLTHRNKILQTVTIRTTNNKPGNEIPQAEPTKIEEIEDFQTIKVTSVTETIRTIKVKDRRTIKTTKISADMVIISVGETIGGNITLEAIIEEIPQTSTTIISRIAFSAAGLSKKQNNIKYWKFSKT